MLIANIEAQIEAKTKEMAAAEFEIERLSRLIDNLKNKLSVQLEKRSLAAYDIMELREQLEEEIEQ